jgi:hypothetical protein
MVVDFHHVRILAKVAWQRVTQMVQKVSRPVTSSGGMGTQRFATSRTVLFRPASENRQNCPRAIPATTHQTAGARGLCNINCFEFLRRACRKSCRLRAERRLGEMMKAQPKAKPPGDNQYRKVDRVLEKPEAPMSLAEAGIDKNLADRARKADAMI